MGNGYYEKIMQGFQKLFAPTQTPLHFLVHTHLKLLCLLARLLFQQSPSQHLLALTVVDSSQLGAPNCEPQGDCDTALLPSPRQGPLLLPSPQVSSSSSLVTFSQDFCIILHQKPSDNEKGTAKPSLGCICVPELP